MGVKPIKPAKDKQCLHCDFLSFDDQPGVTMLCSNPDAKIKKGDNFPKKCPLNDKDIKQ
jgi:hypothetical protein